MSTQIKTMAIKARLANHIRKTLYAKKRLENFNNEEKIIFFNDVYSRYLEMHGELNDYKQKRKDKRDLLKKRLEAPQTKSMMKKLNPRKKNLVKSK